MFKTLKLTVLGCFLFAASFFAQGQVLECNACTTSEYESAAAQWGMMNIEDFNAPATKDVHVVDMASRNLVSYQVTKSLMQRPGMEPRYLVSVELIQTPYAIAQEFGEVKSALQALDSAAGTVDIPSTVISDAWEFIGCAYCQTTLEEYLDQTIGGNILAVTTAVSDFGQFVGVINSDLFVRYEFQLESGGRIEVDLKVNANPGALRIEIVKIFDPDGNEVPQSGSELDGLALQVSSPSRTETINESIARFDRYISGTGRVIIKDCPTTGCDSI